MYKMAEKALTLPEKIRTPKLPDRFKGTIVERWAKFWKNLCLDYYEMVRDLRTDMQNNPKKAFYYIGGLSAAIALSRNNPSEEEFKNDLIKYSNEIILVGDETRNPHTVEHLSKIHRLYSEGVIRRFSIGIASFMYTTDFNRNVGLYKAQCAYTQPRYLSYPGRIVDVGFMGRWWNMFIKTTDYDVNPDEVINHPN